MNRRAWLAAMGCGANLIGCNAILGIHSLDPAANSEGSTMLSEMSAGTSGARAATGASGTKSTSQTAGSGGSVARGGAGSEAAAPAMAAGGMSGPAMGLDHDMAAGKTASANTGGTAAAPAAPVNGKVLDTLRRPVPGAQVRIGTAETTTNDRGEFTLMSAPASYDIELTFARKDYSNETYHEVWVFEEVQRRDPTLQIYPGAANHGLGVNVRADGLMPDLPQGQVIYAAFGGKDGYGRGAAFQNRVEIQGYWQGADVLPGNVHALLFSANSDEVPLEYLAADARAYTLQSGSSDDYVSVNLTGAKPSAAALSGTVKRTQSGGSGRTWIYVRWADGVSLSLPGIYDDAFSLLAPQLPDASIAVVSIQGSTSTPPYAVAFADNLAPGTNAISLTIPATASLRAPAAMKTGVASDMAFEWMPTSENQVHVLRVVGKASNDEICIVTSKTSARLSSLYALPANTKYTWQVEAHGTGMKSVDELVAKGDWISAYWYDDLQGPKRGDGSYSTTELREFTTAP